MVAWQFLIAPSTAAPIGELGTAYDRKMVFRQTQPSTVTFTMNGRHPEALNLIELATDVHCLREGTPMMCARLASTVDTIDRDGHKVEASAADYRGLLARRLTQADRNWVGVDASAALAQLLDDAQQNASFVNAAGLQQGAGGDLGITIPTSWGAGTTGVAVTRTSPAGVPVLGEVTALQADEDDPLFDFDIAAGWPGGPAAWDGTPARTAQVWASRGVRRSGQGTDDPAEAVVLTYRWDPDAPEESDVAGITRKLDPSTYANTVRVTGGSQTVEVAASATSIALLQNNGQALITGIDDKGTTEPTDEQPDPTADDTATIVYYTRPTTRADGATVWDIGVWATGEDYPDIVGQAELDAKAVARLAELSRYQPEWTVKLRAGFWRGPGHVWLGDTIRLIVQSGRLLEDVVLRVREVGVSVDANGTEDVDLVVGPTSSPTPLATLRAHARELAELRRASTR